ncbi:MAG: patatin-like phospholipase family protein [Acidimicrobiaceae bacterium]|nr:patatin-like phospholipase family protein [Acidimicrobiaceae bacterium]
MSRRHILPRRRITTGQDLAPSIRRQPCEAPAPARSALDCLAPGQRPLGVALSGGGLRATLVGLGTLRLLADIGRLGDVRHLTSVSGGSIAAGLVALRWDQLRAHGFTRGAFDELVTVPLLRIVTRRSLQHDLIVRSWQVLGPWRSRTDLLAQRLSTTLFGHTRLDELPTGTWFEISAANLTAGTRFRFTQDLVGDYITGSKATKTLGLRVADAVAWSCAVPGPFNTTILDDLSLPCQAEVGAPELVDGGVYDNLGADALKVRDEMRDLFCIVVNAGGSFNPSPRAGRVPLVGDVWRANSVLYQQVASLRSRSLLDEFKSQNLNGLDGCLFTLRSPHPRDVPASNVAALSDFVDRNPSEPDDGVAELANYPTTLKRVDPSTARRLIYRGWWLTGAILLAYTPELVNEVPRYQQPAV